MSLCRHNSRLLAYRTPFGAVTKGALVRLRLDLAPEWDASLRLWLGDHEEILQGRRSAPGQMEFCFHAPEETGLIWYYFRIRTPEGLRFYGGRGGEGQLSETPPPDWQITVYEPGFETPKWFREGLVYQIFPDRFYREGLGGLARAGSHEAMGRRVYAHGAWEEEPLYAPLPGEEFYEPCDFYGGDLAGIREKLPYLAGLGVSCIYLNPIFESPSNHRYNTADYLRVDPMLGDEAELRALAEAAGRLGMRVMLDGVFSHTGADSVYFDRFGRYGQGAYSHRDSPYFPWYDFSNYPDEYRCWWGFKSLPEVNELCPGYMDFIAGLLSHYGEMGIYDWRLDVADELPDDFIAFLRGRLKAQRPDAVLLGEVWEDASNKEGFGGRRRYVDGLELDSAMGYPFREALCGFLLGSLAGEGLLDRLMALWENYPAPFHAAQLNLLGSHDTVRILTVLSEAPHRDALPREEQAHYRPAPQAAARGRARLKLALLLQMSLPGVPCIYYGDEAGLTGMADPFCRRPYPWGREDGGLVAYTRRLANFRRESPALRGGLCGLCAPGTELFAVLRQGEGESCLALVNRSEREQRAVLALSDFAQGPDAPKLYLAPRYRDLFTGAEHSLREGRLCLSLPPFGAALLHAPDCKGESPVL